MTISTASPRVSYTCDGTTTVFPVPLQAYASTDFAVVVTAPIASGGAETTLTLNSNYTLAPTGSMEPPQWTLTTVGSNSPYTAGYTLQIFINPVQSQQTQYVQGQQFPSLAVQTNMDRLTQMIQRMQDQMNRAVRAPDGDVAPVMLLPSAANRLSSALVTDGNGNITTGVLTSTPVTQALIASLLGLGQTDAESAAGVSPTNVQYPQGDVRRYGAVLDGVTDCTAAMVQACAVGGSIEVLGTMALASASLAALSGFGIRLNSGTTIRGLKGQPTTVTGTTACQVFVSTDVHDVQFIDFFCKGNNVGTSSLGYFWYSTHTSAATQTAGNFFFTRGGLSNFAGYYWVYFDNTAATTYAVSNITVQGGTYTSFAGNGIQGASSILITASVFGFSGSNSITGFYTMTDIRLWENRCVGTFIKNFCTFWSGTVRCKAHDNVLIGFGTDSSFSNDTGCYALTAYDFSHGSGLPPDEIEFYGNTVDGMRDCGIYSSGPNPATTFTNRVSIFGNRFSGQTSTANTSTPKGAIAFASTYLAVAHSNDIYNCAIGIAVAQGSAANGVNWLSKNVCKEMPNSGIGMILSGSTGGQAPKIVVDGFKAQPSAGATNTAAINVNATASVGIYDLDISDVDIGACYNGIIVQAPDSTVPTLGNVRLSNIKLRAVTGTTIEFAGCTNASQRILIDNITFASMQPGAVGLYVGSAPGLTIRDILFQDLVSGATYCWYGGGAQGRLANVQFENVTAANRYDSSSNRMGVDAPAWTGGANDYVQNLNPTVTGSGGFGTSNQKHWTAGWTWDASNAAWAPDVRLTGT
jgi:hypothetical protein